jgi:lysophospholipase L1-like esterase
MWRGLASKIALVVGSLFFTTLIMELGLRFFVTLPSPYQIADARLVQDKRGFWLNKPNAEQYYSNGVDFHNAVARNDENGLRFVPCRGGSKTALRQRVFIIGDSQTYGWGLSDDQSWPNQLQCLANKTGDRFEVHNLGVPGTNLDQYYYRTRLIYDQLRPDDILIYAITWNDWHTDHSGMVRPTSLSGECVNRINLLKGYAFCSGQRLIFQAHKSTWRRTLYKKTGVFIPVFDDLHSAIHTLQLSSAIAYLTIPSIKALYLRLRKGDSLQKVDAKVFATNERLIAQIAADTKKVRNVQFVFLPSRISYVDSVYDAYSKRGSVFKNQDFLFDLAKVGCKQNSLSCHTLFPALRTTRTGKHDFAFDGHLNARGAKLVAQSVLTVIKRSQGGGK